MKVIWSSMLASTGPSVVARHVAELGGGVGDALGGRVEVADADQLRHVDDGDRLAVAVGRVGRHAAVIGAWPPAVPGVPSQASGLVGRSSPPVQADWALARLGRERQGGQHRQGVFAASVFLHVVRVGLHAGRRSADAQSSSVSVPVKEVRDQNGQDQHRADQHDGAVALHAGERQAVLQRLDQDEARAGCR